VTTTGLTTLTSVENLPISVLFMRSWAQWYGGLGILVLVIALLSSHQAIARRLLKSDSHHGLDTTMHRYARRVSTTYAGLTLAAIALLWIAGANPMQAVAHALSGISTGGFSTFDASLRGFDSSAIWLGTAFISFCGAVSLPLYAELKPKRFGRFFSNEEFLGLVAMILVAWLLLLISFYDGTTPLLDAAQDSAMLAISAQTTTGYTTTTVAALSPFAKLVLIVSMTIGGNMGSTAGGVKTLRVLLFLQLAKLTIQRLRIPAHAMVEFRLAGQYYEDRELLRALFYVLLFVGICVLSWSTFVAAGYQPLDSLFEVVSAAGTVGLSTGITRADLEAPLKLVLALDMLAGRLEIVALLVLIHPGLWFGRRLDSL
jgi:trk/ktr system potassium uptake protein